MGKYSAIEWTQATWNPWRGCRKVSTGCKNCYMFRDQKRYGHNPAEVVRSKTTFNDPLKWAKDPNGPRLVFTCSWSDWFIEEADGWRDEAWDIIRATPEITYQILTKRSLRLLEVEEWPANVWIGVSVEDLHTTIRADHLIGIDASVRWLSLEPLLEDVSGGWLANFDWVVVGGESGPDARPMEKDWVRAIQFVCNRFDVPLFFKQWGGNKKINGVWGGNQLDGRTWQQMPITLGRADVR